LALEADGTSAVVVQEHWCPIKRQRRTGRAFARFLCTVSPTRASRAEEPGKSIALPEYRDATMVGNRSAPRAIQE
jgi:hypothetical protein